MKIPSKTMLACSIVAVIALAGCNGDGQYKQSADTSSISSDAVVLSSESGSELSTVSTSATETESTDHVFLDGEYGFTDYLDMKRIPIGADSDGVMVNAVWEAPGLVTGGYYALPEEASCALSFGTLYESPLYEGVSAPLSAEDLFGTYIDHWAEQLSLGTSDLAARTITVASQQDTEFAGCKGTIATGSVSYSEWDSNDILGEVPFTAYATTYESSMTSPDANTIVWCAAVALPDQDVDENAMADVIDKTASSLKFE